MKRTEWNEGLVLHREAMGRRNGQGEWTIARKASEKRTIHMRQANFNVACLQDTVWDIY